MTFEVNRWQPNFNNRRRARRRDFHFQNRNRISSHNVWQNTPRGYEYKEVPKAPQKIRSLEESSAQSQGANSSFANPFTCRPQLHTDALSFKRVNALCHQPFTGHRFNLTVTIPTFSAVRSSVFRFQNSSAESAPPDMVQQSSCPTGNQSIGETPLESEETGKDDVKYLYTVQAAKGGEMVKVVDISEDSNYPNHADKSSKKTLKMAEKETSKDAARRDGRKRKKSTEYISCDICDVGYEFLNSKGEEIFRARCGHMFCQLCLKDLNPYKCPECDIFLQRLCKVFF